MHQHPHNDGNIYNQSVSDGPHSLRGEVNKYNKDILINKSAKLLYEFLIHFSVCKVRVNNMEENATL